VEIEEGADLRAQDVGLERLREIVHGAGLIAQRESATVRVEGGDEDDRHVFAAGSPADEARRLQAVGAGHHDVEHHDRERPVLGEHVA
jgi:hypothetical protein